MDYKYIEQLLERYWACETTLEEEQILRSFFRQESIPAHLLRYRSLFAWQEAEKEVGLGKDFDARILALTERPVVKARRISLTERLAPIFKAAAVVALLLTTGALVQRTADSAGSDEVVLVQYDDCRDTISDPQVAYGEVLPDTLTRIVGEEIATETNN